MKESRLWSSREKQSLSHKFPFQASISTAICYRVQKKIFYQEPAICWRKTLNLSPTRTDLSETNIVKKEPHVTAPRMLFLTCYIYRSKTLNGTVRKGHDGCRVSENTAQIGLNGKVEITNPNPNRWRRLCR